MWQLPADPETPLTRVTGVVNYQLDVADEDHLVPDHPIVGSIRIKVDHKPTITVDPNGFVTRNATPVAAPTVKFTVNDDFGISKVVSHVQVVKADSTAEDPVQVPVSNERVLVDKLPLKMVYTLQLEPLKLSKGDQVRFKLEVWDYRGASEGQSTESEPLAVNVVDQADIAALQSETDSILDKGLGKNIDIQTGSKQPDTGGNK